MKAPPATAQPNDSPPEPHLSDTLTANNSPAKTYGTSGLMRIFIAFLLLTLDLHGTTLVVIRTEKEVIAAADSAIGRGSHIDSDFCKIMRADGVFLAFQGDPDMNVTVNGRPSPQLSFHGFALAKKAAQTHGTAADKADAFKRAALKPFTEAVKLHKTYEPSGYRAWLQNKAQAFQVVFFGLNPDKTPAVAAVDFAVSENARGEVVVTPSERSCPGTNCDPRGGPYFEILGENEKAIELSNRPGFFTGNWDNDARRLIEAEIEARPQFVKAPVDVIRISILGATWMSVKPQCDDSKIIHAGR